MAGMRCCDGEDLVIPRDPRLQGTASELLAGQKKEKALGNWMRVQFLFQ